MNAAASATQPPANAAGSSAADLEDLLYDILATGADPSLPAGTLEAVQAFIHEHARAKKSRAEFLAFFQAYALPTRPQSPALLALPPLEMRGRAVETPRLGLLTEEPDPQLTAAVSVSEDRKWGVWAAAALALIGFGLGSYAWLELHTELAAARAQSDRTAAELSHVRAEAGNLRAALDQNADAMQRVEHNSQLLLQSMASPLDPTRR